MPKRSYDEKVHAGPKSSLCGCAGRYGDANPRKRPRTAEERKKARLAAQKAWEEEQERREEARLAAEKARLEAEKARLAAKKAKQQDTEDREYLKELSVNGGLLNRMPENDPENDSENNDDWSNFFKLCESISPESFIEGLNRVWGDVQDISLNTNKI